MKNNKTYIMWLEEDTFIVDEFKQKALDNMLSLVQYTCWDDAYKELNSNIRKWGAIIINPLCKLGRGDRPNPSKLLPQVFCDIMSLNSKFEVIIPWYIFTDLDGSRFEDMVVSNRKIFDSTWEKPYYNMYEDADNMFRRIKNQTSSVERTKIRQGVHKDFFDSLSALTNFGFSMDDVVSMEDILISLYDGKESNRCNFVNLRKIIEGLFKSMIHFNILPASLTNSSGELNTTACALFLINGSCTNGDYRYHRDEKFLDDVSVSNLYQILKICHGCAHSTSINEKTKKIDTNLYLETTKTNNLLHACALMLVDIILLYFRTLQTKGRENLNFYSVIKV